MQQKIRILKLNENFKKDSGLIKRKWKESIKHRNELLEKSYNVFFAPDQKEKSLSEEDYFTTSKSDSLLEKLKKYDLTNNQKFKKDIHSLAKKYSLYPIYYWEALLTEIIAGNWLKGTIHFANFIVLINFFRGTKKLELVVKEDYKGKKALCMYI